MIAFYQTVQEEKEEEKEKFQSALEAHLPRSNNQVVIKFICPDKHFLFIFVTGATFQQLIESLIEDCGPKKEFAIFNTSDEIQQPFGTLSGHAF